jgi:hypothetical protein
MHATRDTMDVKFLNRAGGRVMRNVRRLLTEHEDERFAGLFSRERKQVASSERGVVKFPGRGRGRESRMLRAPRSFTVTSPPNKRMHATADTQDVIFPRSGLAARDARR